MTNVTTEKVGDTENCLKTDAPTLMFIYILAPSLFRSIVAFARFNTNTSFSQDISGVGYLPSGRNARYRKELINCNPACQNYFLYPAPKPI